MSISSQPHLVHLGDSSTPFRAQIDARSRESTNDLNPGLMSPARGPLAEDEEIAAMSPRARLLIAASALTLLVIGGLAMVFSRNDTLTQSAHDTEDEPLSPSHAPATFPFDSENSLVLDTLLEEEFVKAGTGHSRPLSSGLHAKVNVLNLWATWCEPCRREMPALRDLLASRKNVTFTALRIRDATPWNADDTSTMPERSQVFIDPSEPSRAQKALAAAGIRSAIPLTLVVDCRRRVHWTHEGELTEKSLLDLARTLDGLSDADIECPRKRRPVRAKGAAEEASTGDLDTGTTTGGTSGTDSMEQPEHAPKPSKDSDSELLTPLATSLCGDGRCLPQRGEDCHTCPDDCGCPNGYSSCVREASTETWTCAAHVNQLRD